MNHLVWYPSVQEQPVRLGNVSTVGSALFAGISGSTPKLITLRFTELPMLGSRQLFFDQCYSYSGPIVSLKDCWLRGINLSVNKIYVTGWLGSSVTLQNCVLERSTVSLNAGYVDYYGNGVSVYQNPLSVYLFNNLFWQSSLGLGNYTLESVNPYFSYMAVRDNLFDTSTFSFGGDGAYANYMSVSNNAYYLTADGYPGLNDLTLTNLAYAVGPLGPWYIGSSSPSLINQGSRLASAIGLGLFHYTIQTNQVKEMNTIVDIGYHYVAVDANGKPWDSNGDGIPDYLQDANGNGHVDSGESAWLGLTTDSDYDGRSDLQEISDGTSLSDPNSVLLVRLGYWRFDNTNTWAGDAGQLPLQAAYVTGVPSWSTNAVLIDSTNPAILCYRDVETNGNANINLRNGTIRLWFKPDWSSTNLGGYGPGSAGRLIEMGNYNAAYSNGWWALYFSPDGTQLSFGSSTNGAGRVNLDAGIAWAVGQWHQIVLTYTPTNSLLYLDGQLAVNGLASAYYPNVTERAAGFRIGSDQSGGNHAAGVFDELETFNYPLAAADIQSNYQAAISLDSDGDGWSNIIENFMGSNPYDASSVPSGITMDNPRNGSVIY
jgi:hypothetical protein